MKSKLNAIIVLLLLFLSPATVLAQWSGNPAVNSPICTAAGRQSLGGICNDGLGGAIIVWQDYRSSDTSDIYAQRINSSGFVQWTSNGVPICTAAGSQFEPAIIADGAGGAIIVWTDVRDGDRKILAQRVNSSGTVQWTLNGVIVCNADSAQEDPEVAADGAGGAIIAWTDYRNGDGDIFAQRVNSAGVAQWATNGIPICVASNRQRVRGIARDGADGAYITWEHDRSDTTDGIHVQRVNGSGTIQAPANGVRLSLADSSVGIPSIISDGAGNAIVAWEARRGSGTSGKIFVQKINPVCVIQWNPNGVSISASTSDQERQSMTSDGSGGAIISFQDECCNNGDIYAQRVASNGTIQWGSNGIPVCSATGQQEESAIVSDGTGGAIIGWHDPRISGNADEYAQRVSPAGVAQWTLNGTTISSAPGRQGMPVMVADGGSGAILAWEDSRNGTANVDIYCQRVFANGALTTNVSDEGTNPVAYSLLQNFPNPFNPTTTIRFSLAGSAHAMLSIHNLLGQEIATLISERLPAGSHSVRWDASGMASGVYYYRLVAGDFTETKKLVVLR